MAEPQIENGYTRIANELMEALMKTNFNPYQIRILWAIWRITWGWHKKEDWISNHQLVDMTGIHKAHVSRTISQLITRKIVTKSGNKIAFNKDYQQWRELPKLVTLPKQATKVTRSGNKVTSSGGHKRRIKKEIIYSSEFDLFYTSYPRREAKQKAFKVWESIDMQKGLFEAILQALERQKKYRDQRQRTKQWNPEWPLPATWLNGRRWEDEVPEINTQEERRLAY